MTQSKRFPLACTLACLALALYGCGGTSPGGGDDASLETDAADVLIELDISFSDLDKDQAGDAPLAEGEAGEVAPGGFGAPCVDNQDCDSLYCVEGPEGFICTQTCLDVCPEGFSCRAVPTGPDVTFLCMPDFVRSCVPCAKDFQCYGGRCVQLDGRGWCVAACEEGDTCKKPGYACQAVTLAEGFTDQLCVPVSGSCECLTEEQSGSVRACQVGNVFGTCHGVETCDPAQGWLGCTAATAATEECDGDDDDCNGQIDDGLPATQGCSVTTTGVGTCTGQATCQGVAGWVCDAATPAVEVCNYLDDDCSGVADDPFLVDGAYGLVEHCGACGKSCVDLIPNAVEKCALAGTPHCAVDHCDPGYYQVNELQCFSLSSVLCQPCMVDADCGSGHCATLGEGTFCSAPCDGPEVPAGYVCSELPEGGSWYVPTSGSCSCSPEKAGQTRTCALQNPAGVCYGYETCVPEVGWSGCTATTPADEACNGLDDDCDGAVDEGTAGDVECAIEEPGVGTCHGSLACLGPLGLVCSAQHPALEACNHLDDDCDGDTDEGFVTDGQYLTDANCGACGHDCAEAIDHGTGACVAGQGGPRCVATACDQGYYPLGDALCLPVPDVLCAACSADAQCLGGVCASLGTGTYCTRECGDGLPSCPVGSVCATLEGRPLCQPASGSCDCTAGSSGALRLCRVDNALGTCYGVEKCDPQGGGWQGCDAATPEAEVCNGADDDCDGAVDEGVPLSQPCEITNEWGTCTGVAWCDSTAEGGYACNAAAPEPEQCDYRDNNCDGAIDEGFASTNPATGQPWYATATACGACGEDCHARIPNASEVECDTSTGTPRCVVVACEAGFYQLNDFQCILAPEVTCRACDSDAQCYGGLCAPLEGRSYCLPACTPEAADCDAGFSCQSLPDGRTACVPVQGSCDCGEGNQGAKRACSATNAFGTCLGYQTCDAATGWSACDAPAPSAEVCDGVDNDCNGTMDDGLPESQPCDHSNRFGTCVGEARCVGKLGWVCQSAVPAGEVCDYKDNDCDGVTDDPFVTDGAYLGSDHCGSCGESCAVGFPHATTRCDASGGFPECVVDACDPGYFKLNRYQCIPNLAKLCDPCLTDENCFVEGSHCVPVGGEGSFCGLPCAVDLDCQEGAPGYLCQDFGAYKQCVPASGSCSCDGSKPGLTQACEVQYTPEGGLPYTCFGVRTCAATGWSDCALPAEECNLADDDCDGQVDEGFLDASGLYSSNANCGKCGNNCTLLTFGNATGVCNAAVSPVRCGPQCSPGFFDLDANPNDCECHFTSALDLPGTDDPADPLNLDVNCDGVDGEVGNAIFVAKHGDDANPGTLEAPLKTIQAGLDAAVAQGKRDVYVATGVYEESVALRLGVGLYGGYSADFHVRDAVRYQSAVLAAAPSAGLPGAINALSLSGGAAGATVLDGFQVFAFRARDPGQSSYGVYLSDVDASVRVSNNVLHGGEGGPGARGSDGADGLDGVAGGPGAAAFDLWERFQPAYTVDHCAALDGLGLPRPLSAGGAGGASVCGASDVSGGAGGARSCPEVDPLTGGTAAPTAGEHGLDGLNNLQPGGGGAPGWDVYHQAYSCDGYSSFGPVEGGNGSDGDTGANGTSGVGCQEPGAVQAGAWAPGEGSAGTPGIPGGGGAGGGSGGGAWVHNSCFAKGFGYDNFGGTGGGGGSGGCQGTAAGAGTSGGGAFTLFAIFNVPPVSLPDLHGNSLELGFGGAGGQGGNGGVGGAGGLGATGGVGGGGYAPPSATYPSFKGGKGGQGGQGGHGGGGGGGCGGPSYGLYVTGQGNADLAAWKSANLFLPSGAGGAAGRGGFSLGNPGGDGVAGVSADSSF